MLALLFQEMRQVGVHVVKHRLNRWSRRIQVFLHRDIDLVRCFVEQGLFFRLVPDAEVGQVFAHANQRFDLPGDLHIFFLAVAAGVVRRCMVAEPISDRLDETGAFSVARPRQRALDPVPDGDNIVAVDLNAGNAGSDRFLRQCFRCCLMFYRYGNSPLVIDDHEHDRQVASAGNIHCLVERTFRGSSIAID